MSSVIGWRIATLAGLVLFVRTAYGCSSTADTTAGADAGANESGPGTAVDGGFDATSLPPRQLVCPPSTAAFQPTVWPFPSRFDGGFACADEPTVEKVVNCLGPAPTFPDCEAYIASEATCATCILQPEDASVRGALIREGPLLRVNIGGCVSFALNEPNPANGCGYAINAIEDCTAAACAGCNGHGTLADYEDCIAVASKNVCRAFVEQAATCYRNILPGSPAVRCEGPGGFYSLADNVATIMCGPPAVDAGPDADAGNGGD